MRRLVFFGTILTLTLSAFGQRAPRTATGPESELSVLVGRPTDQAATISVLCDADARGFVEYGQAPGAYPSKTGVRTIKAGEPAEFELTGLRPDSECYYRVHIQRASQPSPVPGPEHRFHTARKVGSTFTFCVQGDSHPERIGRMYDPELYLRAMNNVAADKPDFYFLMGDDFSIERIIESGPPQGDKTRDAVNAVYAGQRAYLGLVGKSTPLMLVNGNHEQAAKYLLDGTANNFAVLAGKARTSYFPLPAPGEFYRGNAKPVEHVGLLRDYYAWEWGDALFVVIDPYWHSDVAVDNEAGTKAPQKPEGGGARRGGGVAGGGERRGGQGNRGAGGDAPAPDQPGNRKGKGNRDLWQITLGDDQYNWLRTTLTQSKAKFKFVFSHHVSGTGRGGVEVAPYYEWGGQDRRGGGRNREGNAAPNDAANERPQPRGLDRFFQARPTWEKPIHQLMHDTGVTIFFQGHDHLYARQELDGVIYQTCPNPADPTFTAFNRDAYTSGDIFPNSGHLRVSITGGSEPACKVEYIRAARPGDEAAHGKNGSIVHTYTVKPRAVKTP